MCSVMPPPFSTVEPVTEMFHGVPVADPYRWLEDQNSPRTRAWIAEQTRYARTYLDAIPGREQIRGRIQELLDIETCDSFLKRGTHYFYRKRVPGQEQPCIYFREGAEGIDQLLIDPSQRGTGNYTSVKPLQISQDGSLLLYEVRQGGERMGTFEILDVANRRTLPDSLAAGYLRGFAFTPDRKGFYYVHETTGEEGRFPRAMYHHVFGTSFQQDRQIFCAGEGKHLRLMIVPGWRQLGLLVCRFLDKTYTDFYVWRMGGAEPPVPILRDAVYSFAPQFLKGRILAAIDLDAPNRRIVEVQPRKNQDPLFFNLVPESDAAIRNWLITAKHIFVSYTHGTKTLVHIFDSYGKRVRQVPCEEGQTVRLACGDPEEDEILLEQDSFTQPPQIDRYSASSAERIPWISRDIPFDPSSYGYSEVHFPSKDGTTIPMFLVGRRRVLEGRTHPTIMTSYGGFGVPMTPQFSVLVAFLLEHGCLFALPNIRGGSEFGVKWYNAAKRRHRQVAFDDFLAAAQWLVATGRTDPGKLGIFGGSNSGLLVATAMTQRPDLFRAALCIVPMLDMLRYHLFDNAQIWKDEFGTADDPDDFAALQQYSPYHQVCDGVAYPATMIVSGDADQKCNALHARKMTARLQAATSSEQPILLDYLALRGHSPALPLSTRIDSLTDRLAFLCQQLAIPVLGVS